jgi:hypothetical protein
MQIIALYGCLSGLASSLIHQYAMYEESKKLGFS